MVSMKRIAEWDTFAASLGKTPRYDKQGQVIPIGKTEENRPRYYVVWHGRAIGIFCNWCARFGTTAQSLQTDKYS